MKTIVFSVCLCLLFCPGLQAQFFPREGSLLNYRIIGFSFPLSYDGPGERVEKYTIEIASGDYSSETAFEKNIIIAAKSKSNKIIAEVPSFGSQYTWRVIYSGHNSRKMNSGLFHFTTGMIPEVDTCITRLRITTPAAKHKDAYVFLDDSRVLYDMSGHPVWYLPLIEGIPIAPRDLKITPQGTITFLTGTGYEINYDGTVLWKAPEKAVINGVGSGHYHHEFTRLANGHYMVLSLDSAIINSHAVCNGGAAPEKMQFGTLIEYDQQGNVAWSWRSADYFAASDLVYYKPGDGNSNIDVHENAFFFDEKNKNIYISFKNISRIVEVKYPEGVVVADYGEKFKPCAPVMGNELFCGQHSCKISDSGYIYLFDNNSCDSMGLPKIVMMKETGAGNNGLKIVWQYDCTMNGKYEKEKKMADFISGGNVEELSDHSIFACMSGLSYCKLFIVDHEKKKLWSARPEKWVAFDKKWHDALQYRASIIENKNDLERLIWNAELNDQATTSQQDSNSPKERGTQ